MNEWRIIEGDCIAAMRTLPAASIDAIVTDPPYGLGFMGRAWDALPPGVKWARECLRVLKPGGHLVAFGGTRTYHRLACAIEDAGFEIRDCLAWMYGNGFPKSLDVSKAIDKAAGAEREVLGAQRDRWTGAGGVLNFATDRPQHAVPIVAGAATPEAERWQGWGTALKPAHEPIVLGRKPLAGTVAANVTAHGTGAINVDACRVEGGERPLRTSETSASGLTGTGGASTYGSFAVRGSKAIGQTSEGRWPANVVMDEEAAALLDAQTGTLTSGSGELRRNADKSRNAHGKFKGGSEPAGARYGDSGGASRFYYCAKASSAERNAGLEGFHPVVTDDGRQTPIDNPRLRAETVCRNTHPTVKPIALMRWLCRLITPPNGTILDPFAGSGTTGIAALREGFAFIGIEREAEYVAIARARIIGDSPLINSDGEAA